MRKRTDLKSGISIREMLVATALVGTISTIGASKFITLNTASDVAEARSNMATLRTGLLAYQVDQGGFPFANNGGTSFANSSWGNIPILERLTTPVAYVSSSDFADPFVPQTRQSAANASLIVDAAPIVVTPPLGHPFTYQSFNATHLARVHEFLNPATSPATAFILQSAGPDLNYYNLGGVIANDIGTADDTINLLYDPTNGTVSQGSLFTSGGASTGAGSGLLLAIEAGAEPTGVGDSFILY